MSWATATTWKTRECQKFAGKTLHRLPKVMRSEVAKTYLGDYKKNYFNANQSLSKLNKIIDDCHLDNQPLREYFNEDRLKEIAELKASMIKSFYTKKNSLIDCVENIRYSAVQMGIEIPENLTDKGLSVRGMDWCWWRRQIRKVTGRSAEKLALNYGMVHKNASIYCSDFAVQRYRDMKKRNREMMETTFLENESGEKFSLQELSDKTNANPVLRRGELMTRLRGFDEYAKYIGNVGVFFTVTAPSKYHTRSRKYNGSTPRDTQHYLNKVWSQIRAQLARDKIDVFGFRVAEPHHDATPHGHYLLFVKPELQTKLVAIFADYALREDGSEKGADKYRLDTEFIDPKKGSATAYISKYISKNIDGYGVGEVKTLKGEPLNISSADAGERIAAWASLWGVRQFQQIGGLPVTVWRTLRQIETEFENESAESARLFADSGDWDLFMRHGIAAGLYLVRETAWEVINHDTGAIQTVAGNENKYGELTPPKVIGVGTIDGEIGCRIFHDWVSSEAPWSTVNNCTQESDKLNSWLLLHDFSPNNNPNIYRDTEVLEKYLKSKGKTK